MRLIHKSVVREKNQPLVSIVIPCYNSEKYVEVSIQSVLQQSYPYIEIIVIDDGSTDASLNIIKSFEGQIKWESRTNSGANAARNRGLVLAEGDFIKFFDSDDIMEKDAVAKQVERMESLPDDAIPYGFCEVYEKPSEVAFSEAFVNLDYSVNVQEQVATLIKGNILTSCPLYRAKLLERVQFDENLAEGEEWNLNILLACTGVKFQFFNDLIYYHRQHDGERISNRVDRMEKSLETSVKTAKSINGFFCGAVPLKIQDAMSFRNFELARYAVRSGCADGASALFDDTYKRYNLTVKHRVYYYLSKIIGSNTVEKLTSLVRLMK